METAFTAIDMPRTLADTAYGSLKRDILDFRLAPGDRFTETEIADRLQVSRTPRARSAVPAGTRRLS